MFTQGKIFTTNQKKYNKGKHNYKLISIDQINIIDKLSSNKFTHLKEAYTNLGDINTKELTTLAELEEEFTKKHSEYIKTYEKYLEELTNNQQSINSKYRNKVIKYDNKYYYVNNYGIARLFDDNVWENKDDSCPNPESNENITHNEFSTLSNGHKMGFKERCKSGGYNVQDSGSGTTGWVDSNGLIYTYDSFLDKHPSCPDEYERISSIHFNAMKKGGTMDSNKPCSRYNLNQGTYGKLMSLNNELLTIIRKMKREVTQLTSKDKNLKDKIDIEKTKIVQAYNKLDEVVKQVNASKKKIQSYRGEIEDQNLSVPSIQMHHLIWVVLGGAFIGAAIYNAS